jgi:hydroxymethylpyrimidine/phosphomethylpyrimidine kinase
MTTPTSFASPQPRYVRVLSIAGSDSGGGAGIQADLKTFSALGCYGMTAITAITAQNTLGVTGIHGVPPDMLRAQIDAVAQDIGVDAVKIGMLASPEVVRVVAQAIRTHRLPHVVLDPVMVATSGDRLIASETVQVLVNELFPLAAVVTPNLDEAALLLGREIEGIDDLDDAARDLLALGAPAVLLKGGHLKGERVVDLLATRSGLRQRLESARIATHNGHGTGCTLSSAIAAFLAQGCRCRRPWKSPCLHPGRHCCRCRCAHRPGPRATEPRLCAHGAAGVASLEKVLIFSASCAYAVSAGSSYFDSNQRALACRVAQASTKLNASAGKAEPSPGNTLGARWYTAMPASHSTTGKAFTTGPAQQRGGVGAKGQAPQDDAEQGHEHRAEQQQERLQAVHGQHQRQSPCTTRLTARPQRRTLQRGSRLWADTAPE